LNVFLEDVLKKYITEEVCRRIEGTLK